MGQKMQEQASTQRTTASSTDFPQGVVEQLQSLWQTQAVDGATSDMVHQVLHDAIVTGVLPPEQWLGEVQLARLFDVSRTPVREALLRLEVEQMAARVPRRGLIVSRITPKQLLDVYVVREALDGLAAYLAATSATAADISQLETLNAQFARAAELGDTHAMAEFNLQFHEAMANATDNALLVEFVRSVHRSVRRFRTTTLAHPGRPQTAFQAHQAMIEAIQNHEPERARTLAMEDMAVARNIRIAMLAEELATPAESAQRD